MKPIETTQISIKFLIMFPRQQWPELEDQNSGPGSCKTFAASSPPWDGNPWLNYGGFHHQPLEIYWCILVGGIPTPLKNMKVSWDYDSQYMEK